MSPKRSTHRGKRRLEGLLRAASLAATVTSGAFISGAVFNGPAISGSTGAEGPPQQLPIEARWCLAAAGPCLQLEVPHTPQQYAWGLQLRPPLAPLQGMWFRIDPPEPVRFWMHRTPEPLDMVFVREGQVVAIEAEARPCPRLPCRSYGPDQAVDGVVELAAGQAKALGIRLGTAVQIAPLPPQAAPKAAPAAPTQHGPARP